MNPAYKIVVLAVFILTLVFAPVSSAAEKPVKNPIFEGNAIAEVASPPEISGVYNVPERPGMKVRVFAHPEKPTAPPAPGLTAKPNVSPSPSVSVNNSLVCGLADPESASVVGKTGWKIPTGSWPFQLNLSSVPATVGSGNLNTIVTSGFNQYTTASGNKVSFVRGADTTVSRARLDGRNIITWARASSGTLGVTYVWYYPSTGLAAEIDTIMNSRYKWTWSGSNVCADDTTYDAQNIMTHELGHWLGLEDEYDTGLFGNNTMFGYGSRGEVMKNTLTNGDVSGVGSIYSP